MNHSQIQEINNLLIAYAAGEYHKKGKISKDRNEMDMIIAGVNMLGEELLDTTVSRDYFSGIYNAVSNMVLVLSPKGIIEDSNSAVCETLQCQTSVLIGQSIDGIVEPGKSSFFKRTRVRLGKNHASTQGEVNFSSVKGKLIPVSYSCSKIIDKVGKLKGYLLVAEDITERKDTENLVLRTIVETQDNEQQRVADDLHDSLGQELSTVKLLLTAIKENVKPTEKKYIDAFETCKSLLDNSIKNIRDICFNLMPASLERGGLVAALEELAHRQGQSGIIQYDFQTPTTDLSLDIHLEIAMYRIAQEFITNSLKHAKSSKITLNLSTDSDFVYLDIEDNGKGFNVKSSGYREGRGLNTMRSRVKAYHGSFNLTSRLGLGTKLSIKFKRSKSQ